MGRYLDSKGLGESLQALYQSGKSVDVLSQEKQVLAWTPDGSNITSSRDDAGRHPQ